MFKTYKEKQTVSTDLYINLNKNLTLCLFSIHI